MASWDVYTEDFQIVCGVLGVFATILGLLSYLVKERLYISEALIALLVGAAVSYGAGFIDPLHYAGDKQGLEKVTLNFSRLVLCVQVFIAGWQLPAQYLRHKLRSLAILLGPGMGITWIISSLLIWALSEDATFLEALIVGACISPTDPVLANTVIKGRFADEQVPTDMAQLIAAESGANDGLGYPFLFLGLWLYRARQGSEVTAAEAIGLWFGDTWAYVVLLSVFWGAVVGYVAGKALKIGYNIRYVDRESFHAFPIFLVLLLIGTCGLIGSDDILSCFVAGNAISWDDWFRQQTMYDSFQPTLDMMLNQAMFLWLGAVSPWSDFANSGQVIGLGKLIALAFLILLLRRPPVIFALQSLLEEVQGSRNAIFMGYFGPIGVSAIFYLYVALKFLGENVSAPEDARTQHLRQLITTVVWFIVVCSTIVHGVSIAALQTFKYIAHRLGIHRSEDTHHYSLRELTDKETETWRNGWLHTQIQHLSQDARLRIQQDLPPLAREVGWRTIATHRENQEA